MNLKRKKNRNNLSDVNSDTETQLNSLLNALKSFKNGDFTVRMRVKKNGIMEEIAETFNDIIVLNEKTTGEIIRVSKIVGEEGMLQERASLGASIMAWI